MDIEQVIKAIFKADTNELSRQVAKLDSQIATLEGRVSSANAKFVSLGKAEIGAGVFDNIERKLSKAVSPQIEIDPAMQSRMGKAQADAARFALEAGASEIDLIARELAQPLSPKIEIDDATMFRMEKTRLEAEKLKMELAGELPDAAVKSGGKLRGLAGIIESLGKRFGSLVSKIPFIGELVTIAGAVYGAFKALFALFGSSGFTKLELDLMRVNERLAETAKSVGVLWGELKKLEIDPKDAKRNNLDTARKNAEDVARAAEQSGDKAWEAAAKEDVARHDQNLRIYDAKAAVAAATNRRKSLERILNDSKEAAIVFESRVDHEQQLIDVMDVEHPSDDRRKAIGIAVDALNIQKSLLRGHKAVIAELPAQIENAIDTERLAKDALENATEFRWKDDTEVKVNVGSARITVNQRITTNDPAQLAGATLLGAFRGLVKQTLTSSVLSPSVGR